MRAFVPLVLACAPFVCGAGGTASSEPDAGIGRPCRYQLTGGYQGRVICYSEQQWERGYDASGAHLDEDPAAVPRVQVDFALEEASHYGIQGPSSVNGWALLRLPDGTRWHASTSVDSKKKKLGTFAVTITDMRTVKIKGKDRVELHGEIDTKMVSTAVGTTADVDLHATF
jgi:hypothetical protein